MTGHYHNSTGVWHTIGGRSLLRRDEYSLATALSESGYVTGLPVTIPWSFPNATKLPDRVRKPTRIPTEAEMPAAAPTPELLARKSSAAATRSLVFLMTGPSATSAQVTPKSGLRSRPRSWSPDRSRCRGSG